MKIHTKSKEEFNAFILTKIFKSKGYYTTWNSLLENIQLANTIEDYRLRKTAFNDIATQAPRKNNIFTKLLTYEDVPEFVEKTFTVLYEYCKTNE